MALINVISSSDLFHMARRMDRGDDFGYKGWNAIGGYLENLSDGLGEDVEVDIIAICCDYSMAEDVSAWWEEYGGYSSIDPEYWEEMDYDEKLAAIEEYLQYRTIVICCERDCIIWQAF